MLQLKPFFFFHIQCLKNTKAPSNKNRTHRTQHTLSLFTKQKKKQPPIMRLLLLLLLPTALSIILPTPDFTINFLNGVAISTPKNIQTDDSSSSSPSVLSIGSSGTTPMASYAGPDQSTLDAINTETGGHPMIQISGQNSVLPLKNDWTVDVVMKIWRSDQLAYRTIFSSENANVILAIKRVGVYDGDNSQDTLGFQVDGYWSETPMEDTAWSGDTTSAVRWSGGWATMALAKAYCATNNACLGVSLKHANGGTCGGVTGTYYTWEAGTQKKCINWRSWAKNNPVQGTDYTCNSGFHEFKPPVFASTFTGSNAWVRLTVTFVKSTQTYSAYLDGSKVGTVANVCASSSNFGVSAVGGDARQRTGELSQSLGALSHFDVYANQALSDAQISMLEKGNGMCSDGTTPPNLQLATNRDTKIWPSGSSGPEPGCTYSADPCVWYVKSLFLATTKYLYHQSYI